MVSATGLGERARGTGKPAKQLSSANAAPVVSQPSFLASVGTGRVCPAHQSSDKGTEMSNTYLTIPKQYPVVVKRDSGDPSYVLIDQDNGDDSQADLVSLHVNQVPAVIKALKAFLKDVPDV